MSTSTDSNGAVWADWRLGQLIRRIDQLLLAQKSEALREFDLSVAQYSALVALSASKGMSGAQLARAAGVTAQTMTIILQNLEGKGLIERSPSELHPKVLSTRLTQKGRATVKKADARVQAVEDRLATAYDSGEQESMHQLLGRAITVLSSPA